MIDKRVESMQIGVDEVVRLRRERDDAVWLLEKVRAALHIAVRFAVEFDSPLTMPDPAMPYKSGEVCAEALTAMEEIDAYLAKREEG